ncbi:auxin efflux carrier [Oscillochloris trichoides DG-6]|uniref:Auxin efflux carrier n=1 Tax=Oscillochloris trichoides DG-6 TaxID=765420 RepID=E1IHU6_9CHLR|nr:AEC family transporter [Oscillochloris trichoides]EFO79221.1 auxin efflux carrier [Oscillochloris trichoides DG-6]
MPQLITIFLNVLAPVFLLVLTGYLAGPRLQLEARTLSRLAYFILTPAFVFNVLSQTRIELGLAGRMISFITLVYLGSVMVAFVVARLLRRSQAMTSAYVMIAVFGNVGNFGLPIIQFATGPEALGIATIYFLANLVLAFIVCVAAANVSRGFNLAMVGQVFRTPALIAIVPALLVNAANIQLPPVVVRPLDLLSGALIPIMLLILGVQLAGAGKLRFSPDLFISSAIRLISGPVFAFSLIGWFALPDLEATVGILQSSMPAAILVSIIALENDLLPQFVTTTVLFSNLVSVFSLAVVLVLL